MMTVLTVIGVIALICLAFAVFATGCSYVANGDFFGWLFIGEPLTRAAGEILKIAVLAIAALIESSNNS